MGRNTHQTNQIEQLKKCGDEHAIHNKFRSIAFSRSVRPVFEAHTMNSRAEKLNLLLFYQTQKQAWELQEALCFHQQVMSPKQVVCLPYWCPSQCTAQ